MSFDVRDLNRPLDVFTRDNVFLGSILKVLPDSGDGGAVVVGRWWGLLGRRTIAAEEILNFSLERVILKRTSQELGVRRPGASHP